MVVEPVNISVRDLVPSAQARAPAVKGTPQKGKEDVKSEKAPDLSRLSRVVANVQKNLGMIHDVDLQFKVHKPTGEVMVTVKDESTGEVIREIPPQEILNLAAKIDAMAGLIFDQKG